MYLYPIVVLCDDFRHIYLNIVLLEHSMTRLTKYQIDLLRKMIYVDVI